MTTNRQPIIVGIAGGTASGKTTFSNALADALAPLRVRLFHMDEYFKPPEERPHITAPITGIDYRDDNCPEALELARLEQDLSAACNAGFDVILVEGLFALREEFLLQKMQLKLFIDCLADERIVRRIRRNLTMGQEFDEITTRYLDAVRCRHDELIEPTKWRADWILNGSVPSKRALAAVSQYIRSLC